MNILQGATTKMKFALLSQLVLSLFATQGSAFAPGSRILDNAGSLQLSAAVMEDLTFSPPDAVGAGIEEQACIDAAKQFLLSIDH